MTITELSAFPLPVSRGKRDSSIRVYHARNRVVHEERDPFLGFGAIGIAAAMQLHAAVGTRDEFGAAEGRDEVPVTRLTQAIHESLHSAASLRKGVGQIWGKGE